MVILRPELLRDIAPRYSVGQDVVYRLNIERFLNFRVGSKIEMQEYDCWKDSQDK